jgi:hypothetical protein
MKFTTLAEGALYTQRPFSTRNRHNLRTYFFDLLSGACVKADPATILAACEDLGFASIFAAFEATDLDVFSFFAMDTIRS